jgi:hypothetical protein
MGTASHLASARTAAPFLMVALFSLTVIRADEAVLLNGQRVEGRLPADEQGRLVFQPVGSEALLLPDRIDHIRFPATRVLPLRAGAPFRILLHGGQHITGELLGLTSDKLELRTAWRERITIPRADLAAVSHLPGFVTLFVDDFENDLKSWRLTGTPALTARQHTSGRQGLCFNSPGQQAEYTLAQSLTTGRVGINFHDAARPAGLAWQIETEFAGSVAWPAVRVVSDPRAGNYTAEVSGAPTTKVRLPQSGGWQRLEIEFSPDTLVVYVDDDVLLSCGRPGAGGALRKVRLSCRAVHSGIGESGEVFFDDFAVAQTVPDLPHPKGDPDQDEVWFVSGDQLFGTIADATVQGVHLQGAFGSRTLRWSDVRGIYFKQSSAAKKLESKNVRIWLHPGIGFEPDVLEGTIRRLDKDHLVLHHDVLGELQIDRKRLHRIRPR